VKSEMDVMDMDERQREGWLKANRATLMIVGLIWIGMIVHEFVQGRRPVFLLVALPLIALLRFALYRYYTRGA